MTMAHISDLNLLSLEEFRDKLYKCCSSVRFADKISSRRPFYSIDNLFEVADEIWLRELGPKDWLESFNAHPRIGDREELRKKLAGVKSMEGEEQAGTAAASEELLDGLEQGNKDYEAKFGFIFLICATGKSADEMLCALRQRMGNTPYDEILVAAQEQSKITKLRILKLVQEATPNDIKNSKL